MMRSGNRNMRRMMNRMGVSMDVIDDVQEVIIRTSTKEIVIQNPQVNMADAKDSTTFIVAAESYEERELEAPVYSEDDIELLCLHANVDRDTAISALKDCDGEVATAMVRLKSD